MHYVTVKQFLELLGRAVLVTVDGGPFLHDWETEEVTHVTENEVVRFSWTDSDYDYVSILTEGHILNGHFQEDGAFICSDTEENDTEIRFYTITQITITP